MIGIRPTYHWILNQIRRGQVEDTSMRKKFFAVGGIRMHRTSIGFDGAATYMDGGSYDGTCISGERYYQSFLSEEE